MALLPRLVALIVLCIACYRLVTLARPAAAFADTVVPGPESVILPGMAAFASLAVLAGGIRVLAAELVGVSLWSLLFRTAVTLRTIRLLAALITVAVFSVLLPLVRQRKDVLVNGFTRPASRYAQLQPVRTPAPSEPLSPRSIAQLFTQFLRDLPRELRDATRATVVEAFVTYVSNLLQDTMNEQVTHLQTKQTIRQKLAEAETDKTLRQIEKDMLEQALKLDNETLELRLKSAQALKDMAERLLTHDDSAFERMLSDAIARQIRRTIQPGD